MTTLEDRVTLLEQEISDLQGYQEVLSPNYLTYNPNTGQVGAVFTGGVSIPEQSTPDDFTPQTTFNFVNPTEGLVEALYGYRNEATGQHSLAMVAQAGGLGIGSQGATVRASSWDGSAQSSEIALTVTDAVNGQTERTAITSSGNSGFAQMLPPIAGGTLHGFYADDNGGNFFDSGVIALPANSVVDWEFPTGGGPNATGWTLAVPIGSLRELGSVVPPPQWTFTPDLFTFTIHFYNETAIAGSVRWRGIVVGH